MVVVNNKPRMRCSGARAVCRRPDGAGPPEAHGSSDTAISGQARRRSRAHLQADVCAGRRYVWEHPERCKWSAHARPMFSHVRARPAPAAYTRRDNSR
ncbi:hypothetical protein EVAR_28503_1 [Eumeta japonica]|uniref:Uncharacterized protein n=1 Tax=Eumeta variegata TaxID=151549 RepID=A0A4C1WPF8_EUMVA|nr:hypothetical protein EVAR_28503_1 [Eumeta japonica]